MPSHLPQDVDEQLRGIDEQQNIDMSLVMGAPSARPSQTHDQMSMPNRPSMRLGRMRTLSTEHAAVGSMVSISRQTSLQSSHGLVTPPPLNLPHAPCQYPSIF